MARTETTSPTEPVEGRVDIADGSHRAPLVHQFGPFAVVPLGFA